MSEIKNILDNWDVIDNIEMNSDAKKIKIEYLRKLKGMSKKGSSFPHTGGISSEDIAKLQAKIRKEKEAKSKAHLVPFYQDYSSKMEKELYSKEVKPTKPRVKQVKKSAKVKFDQIKKNSFEESKQPSTNFWDDFEPSKNEKKKGKIKQVKSTKNKEDPFCWDFEPSKPKNPERQPKKGKIDGFEFDFAGGNSNTQESENNWFDDFEPKPPVVKAESFFDFEDSEPQKQVQNETRVKETKQKQPQNTDFLFEDSPPKNKKNTADFLFEDSQSKKQEKTADFLFEESVPKKQQKTADFLFEEAPKPTIKDQDLDIFEEHKGSQDHEEDDLIQISHENQPDLLFGDFDNQEAQAVSKDENLLFGDSVQKDDQTELLFGDNPEKQDTGENYYATLFDPSQPSSEPKNDFMNKLTDLYTESGVITKKKEDEGVLKPEKPQVIKDLEDNKTFKSEAEQLGNNFWNSAYNKPYASMSASSGDYSGYKSNKSAFKSQKSKNIETKETVKPNKPEDEIFKSDGFLGSRGKANKAKVRKIKIYNF